VKVPFVKTQPYLPLLLLAHIWVIQSVGLLQRAALNILGASVVHIRVGQILGVELPGLSLVLHLLPEVIMPSFASISSVRALTSLHPHPNLGFTWSL
jgi:hypothetical protein